MASQSEKLATSLEALKELMGPSKRGIFMSKELSRVHRERLISAGFLVEVKKGWLLLSDPTQNSGDSTLWYANFWNFVSVFLNERFGKDYCLSAKSSLILHTGATTIPAQITVITKRSSGKTVQLPFNSSLFLYQDEKNVSEEREEKNGLQALSLPEAITRLTRSYFEQHPLESVVALSQIGAASQLLYYLLKRGSSTIAGYLVGAYQHIGREDVANDILESMVSAGYRVHVENPFVKPLAPMPSRIQSPYVGRLQAIWDRYRDPIMQLFEHEPGLPQNTHAYLMAVDERYSDDAYNSLSIEGYEVTHALIERVRLGKWDPSNEPKDIQQKDALAAKGYKMAFDAVRLSLTQVLSGKNPGSVVKKDIATWYQSLFQPSVQAGLIQNYHLVGYRPNQVYIRDSRHVPFPQSALLDSMDMLFELLGKEENAAVRAILGHLIFVHIHPYSDGNGRIGRFLMNVMLASGGYPWTVVPVTRSTEYMNALEKAHCDNNIEDFSRFIKSLISNPAI